MILIIENLKINHYTRFCTSHYVVHDLLAKDFKWKDTMVFQLAIFKVKRFPERLVDMFVMFLYTKRCVSVHSVL